MTKFMVVPCFNEAARWNMDYWQSMMTLEDVSWIFVDDGSTDETRKLAGIACGSGKGEVLSLPVNGGKSEAVRKGLLKALEAKPASGTLVGFMDADGAFTRQDVERFIKISVERLDKNENTDAVWAARVALAGREIRRSAKRHCIGRSVATFLSLGDRELPYDTQAGLKIFYPSASLRGSLQEPFLTRWLFELEILNRWRGLEGSRMRVWEVPLTSWSETPGSRITFAESIRIAKELILIKKQQFDCGKDSKSP